MWNMLLIYYIVGFMCFFRSSGKCDKKKFSVFVLAFVVVCFVYSLFGMPFVGSVSLVFLHSLEKA